MQGIHLCQQTDVLCRIASHKRHGRRTAPVRDVPAIGELRHAARDLCTGETGHFSRYCRSTPLSARLQRTYPNCLSVSAIQP